VTDTGADGPVVDVEWAPVTAQPETKQDAPVLSSPAPVLSSTEIVSDRPKPPSWVIGIAGISCVLAGLFFLGSLGRTLGYPVGFLTPAQQLFLVSQFLLVIVPGIAVLRFIVQRRWEPNLLVYGTLAALAGNMAMAYLAYMDLFGALGFITLAAGLLAARRNRAWAWVAAGAGVILYSVYPVTVIATYSYAIDANFAGFWLTSLPLPIIATILLRDRMAAGRNRPSASSPDEATQSPAASSFSRPIEPAASPQPRVDSAAATDVVVKLRQLAELKQQGILTEEEFQAKKTELLARL
jgi:hypothetical protein